MSIFADIEFGWQGETYTVKANEVMKLIAKVEDVISLQELTNGPKLSRVSEAYAVALAYAGCETADIEAVYASLFKSGGANVQDSITSLVMLMLPPETYNPENNGGGKEKGQAAKV